jgi:outer membrane lipoprotein-sorting protein
MSQPAPDPRDALLDREAKALRDMAIPPGPPASAHARTVSALELEFRTPPKGPFFWRKSPMFTFVKIAAALLVTVGGLTFLARPQPASAESFAEVAAKLHDAHTLSYRMTMHMSGQEKPMVSLLSYKTPGMLRSESGPPGGPVAVIDTVKGKTLVTNPQDKLAILLDSPTAAQGKMTDNAATTIENLRQLAAQTGEPAGEKTIGAVRARGFHVQVAGIEHTVWIDPTAKLPLLIELKGKIGETTLEGVLSDIQIDPKLDDSLFSLEPPAGYTVQKAATKIATPLDGLVKMLRIYAETNEGAFPDRLDDLPAFQKAVAKWAREKTANQEKSAIQAEAIEVAQSMAMVTVMVQLEKDRYVYQPHGIKLGDAKAIVFAYKPQGSEMWKAVYGDLHVTEVAADQVPGKGK